MNTDTITDYFEDTVVSFMEGMTMTLDTMGYAANRLGRKFGENIPTVESCFGAYHIDHKMPALHYSSKVLGVSFVVGGYLSNPESFLLPQVFLLLDLALYGMVKI